MKSIFSKLWNLPNSLFRAFAEKLVISWLRDGLAGKKGAFVERTLLFLKGKKTLSGFWLGFAAFLSWVFEASTAQTALLGSLSAVFLAVGFVDKAIQGPGRPDFLAESWIYRIVVDNAGALASGLTTAFTYAAGSDCIAWQLRTLSLSCAGQINLLIVLAAFFMYLGVLDLAFLSKTSAQIKNLERYFPHEVHA